MTIDADAHIAAFNEAVRNGTWRLFADRFALDATLALVGPPVGPFVGRAAIVEADAAQPPDDTLSRTGDDVVDGDELVVPYRWDTGGGTGTMRFTASPDALVQQLTVTFD